MDFKYSICPLVAGLFLFSGLTLKGASFVFWLEGIRKNKRIRPSMVQRIHIENLILDSCQNSVVEVKILAGAVRLAVNPLLSFLPCSHDVICFRRIPPSYHHMRFVHTDRYFTLTDSFLDTLWCSIAFKKIFQKLCVIFLNIHLILSVGAQKKIIPIGILRCGYSVSEETFFERLWKIRDFFRRAHVTCLNVFANVWRCGTSSQGKNCNDCQYVFHANKYIPQPFGSQA